MERLLKFEDLKKEGYIQEIGRTFKHRAIRNKRIFLCSACGCFSESFEKPEGKKKFILSRCFWCKVNNSVGIK